ncbi:MAG: 50S ribosomal protein L23 [Parcubacteria group bacterium GW2011_GWA1_42_7]|nr:MAG: 50S ribosomal protein L23 [Parcubacteria group bacterium GW2011_GWB1_42_6]KKS69588.1 MAG: 50S ribosomal protein L23 [Parcubacteria group bacterium GW2011_GWA1_42_7]KKS92140.1 MAG: 50S ribosomal protein L23 [Parcubacteria group bacterium GW2011_GWC1_43_12]
MGLFGKTKKEEEKKPVSRVKAAARKREPSVKAVKESAKTEVSLAKSKPAKKEFNQAWRVIKCPLVTEKSSGLAGLNKYIFEVYPEANKSEVRKAVRDLYGVNVESVNIINVPGKKRRVGKHTGFHSGFKKAVVSISAGESIEIIAG